MPMYLTDSGDSMKPTEEKPLKIHIGKRGGVRVDADEFFSQPEVQEKLKKMKDMTIVGTVLDDKHNTSKKES